MASRKVVEAQRQNEWLLGSQRTVRSVSRSALYLARNRIQHCAGANRISIALNRCLSGRKRACKSMSKILASTSTRSNNSMHRRLATPIWNAAQRQLVREGRIHNYLRMLWGKKIFQWSATPRAALEAMIELNNKYALDGRDPNSYSGIFWVLGRYDRAWGPERPVFGKLRYMTSENTAKKHALGEYLKRYAK